MAQRRFVAAAVLIGAMVLVGGFFSYQTFLNKANVGHADSIPIGGYVVIKAYHANGQLYATWQGHNSLYGWAVSGLAQCISGNSSTPEGYQGCTMTPDVWTSGPSEPPFYATATNTLLPGGCTTNTNPPTCTGWQTSGTITFVSGSPSNAVYPAPLDEAGAGYTYTPFDTVSISPSITVNPGDTLVVTVTFSIT